VTTKKIFTNDELFSTKTTTNASAPFLLDSYTVYGVTLSLLDSSGTEIGAGGDGLMEIENNQLKMTLNDVGNNFGD
jgi:hypothetical protein